MLWAQGLYSRQDRDATTCGPCKDCVLLSGTGRPILVVPLIRLECIAGVYVLIQNKRLVLGEACKYCDDKI